MSKAMTPTIRLCRGLPLEAGGLLDGSVAASATSKPPMECPMRMTGPSGWVESLDVSEISSAGVYNHEVDRTIP